MWRISPSTWDERARYASEPLDGLATLKASISRLTGMDGRSADYPCFIRVVPLYPNKGGVACRRGRLSACSETGDLGLFERWMDRRSSSIGRVSAVLASRRSLRGI